MSGPETSTGDEGTGAVEAGDGAGTGAVEAADGRTDAVRNDEGTDAVRMGAVDTEVHGKAARRQLAYAVLLCLVGAGLAVFAATRIWAVEVTARPAPLPSVRVTRTGGELLPWLPALAVVGLAGAGAVLATRGMGRRLVGVLLLLVGLAVAVGGGYGVAGLAHEDTTVGWPALCVLGGVLALAGGAVTVLRGGSWPVMGARYERRSTRENSPVQDGSAAGSMAANDGKGPVVARRTVAAWDALDRGEDPTVS